MGLSAPLLRRVALGLALLGVALATAGCGGGVSATLDPVASAATKSEDAGTARITFDASFSSPSLGGRTFRMSGDGLVAHGAAELSVDMSRMLREAGAPAGTDGSLKEVFLTEDGDYVLYMRLGVLTSHLPDGKQWIKVDLSKVGAKEGVDFSKLTGGGASQNPAQLLEMLRATSGDVENLGTETLDGVTTTHYHATVDLAKAAKLQGVDDQTVQQLLAQVGSSDVPIDVWIGADGLVRQFRMSYATSVSNASVDMTMTIGFSDYGTSADVTAPPADQVYDGTALLTGAQPSS